MHLRSIVFAFALGTGSLSGQSVPYSARVSLNVTEGTSGLLQSITSNALRRLQGIEVVSKLEKADYEWSIVAVCGAAGASGEVPCATSDTYAVAYSIRAPMTPRQAVGFWQDGQIFLGKDDSEVSGPAFEKLLSASDTLFAYVRFQSTEVATGVMLLGRDRIEPALDALVREFDSSCLERKRVFLRLFQEKRMRELGRLTATLPSSMCSR